MPEEEDYTVYCSPSEVWEGQLSLWEEEEEEEEAYLGYVGKILKQVSWGSPDGSLEWPRPVSCEWPWVCS